MEIHIRNAPFTDAEKAKIGAMGFDRCDWGYPDVTLADPVAFFKGIKEQFDLIDNALPQTPAKGSVFHPDQDSEPSILDWFHEIGTA